MKRPALFVALVISAFPLGYAMDTAADEGGAFALVAFLFPPALAHALVLRQALTDRSARPFGLIWSGLLKGGVVGVALGVGLRIGMRVVAVLAGEAPTFTVGGTVFVLGLGVFFGASFGALLAGIRRWLPPTAPGLALGCIAAAFFWFPFFDAAARDLSDVLPDAAIVLLTTLLSSLWLGWGVGLNRWLATGSPPSGQRPGTSPDSSAF